VTNKSSGKRSHPREPFKLFSKPAGSSLRSAKHSAAIIQPPALPLNQQPGLPYSGLSRYRDFGCGAARSLDCPARRPSSLCDQISPRDFVNCLFHLFFPHPAKRSRLYLALVFFSRWNSASRLRTQSVIPPSAAKTRHDVGGAAHFLVSTRLRSAEMAGRARLRRWLEL
jgi:hypothetical protein